MHKVMHIFLYFACAINIGDNVDTEINLKYTYTCKTLLLMITFIMFARFLYCFANVLFSGNYHRVYKHLLLKLIQRSKSLDYIFFKYFTFLTAF